MGGRASRSLKKMFVAPPGARMRGHARARRARPHIRARRLARLTPFKTCAIGGQRAGQHAERAAARGTRRRGIMLREGGALAGADFACG